MTLPDHTVRSIDHDRHDPLLVAEAADRSGTLPKALADCPDCRSLHAELLALAQALPIAALPTRPRDYTISSTQAAELRPSGWRRVLASIGTARDTVTRPLAIGLTTIGLAGLLVSTVPGVLPFSGAAVGESTGGTDAAIAAPAAPEAAPGGAEAAPSAAASGDGEPAYRASDAAGADGKASPGAGANLDGTVPLEQTAAPDQIAPDATVMLDDDGQAQGPAIVSLLLVLAGTGLFALRRGRRRVAND
jgi:hypothetical protein